MSDTSNGLLRGHAGNRCLICLIDDLEVVQVTEISYVKWVA